MMSKVEKYCKLLYPNYDLLSIKEQYYAAGDEQFVAKNIEEIDRKFQEIVSAIEARGERANQQEIIKRVFNEVRVERYTDLLHPNSAELDSKQQNYIDGDKKFILENIELIARKIKDMQEVKKGKISEQEVVKAVVDEVRTDKYTELLHPDYDKLSSKEQNYASDDKRIVLENISEIDRKFQDVISDKETAGEINKQEVMQSIFYSLGDKNITPEQIGRRTIDVSTLTKREVEAKENEARINYRGEVERDDN